MRITSEFNAIINCAKYGIKFHPEMLILLPFNFEGKKKLNYLMDKKKEEIILM